MKKLALIFAFVLAGCSQTEGHNGTNTDVASVDEDDVVDLFEHAEFNINNIKLTKLVGDDKFVCGTVDYQTGIGFMGARRFIGRFDEKTILEDFAYQLKGRDKAEAGACEAATNLSNTFAGDGAAYLNKIERCTTEEVQAKVIEFKRQWGVLCNQNHNKADHG